MKKFRYLLLFISLISSFASGLEAQPAKPDFAYPKTVGKNAEADLKVALRDQNGPATLDALIRWSLSRTAVNPNAVTEVTTRLHKVSDKVKSPVTRALISLLEADITANDSLAFAVWSNDSLALASVHVTDWRNVINAEPRFFPTLYDFAAAKAAVRRYRSDVSAAMSRYYSSSPVCQIYWAMNDADSDERLFALYDSVSSEPESAFVLYRLTSRAHNFEMRRKVYTLVENWLAQPWAASSPYRSDVQNIAENLTSPSVSLKGESVIARGDVYRVHLQAECLNSCSVRVCKNKVPIETRSLTFAGSGVFRVDTVLEFTFKEYGEYEITPSFKGDVSRSRSNLTVAVTDFLLWRQSYGPDFKTYALDALNGKPLTDVTFREERNRIFASRGADTATPPIYKGYYNKNTDRVAHTANILTDLGIYHPGDSLRFVAVLMQSTVSQTTPEAGKAVKVILRNANWQPVDTLNLISDNYGRVYGGFLLPTDGLTGWYSLEIPSYSSTAVTVTDYKAPTFEVKTECERIDSTSVRVSGSAVGFNGFPIIDSSVAIEVRELPRWICWRDFSNFNGSVVAADTVMTDSVGQFVAVLNVPAGLNFKTSAAVTSLSGETADASAFVPVRPYMIRADLPVYFVPGSAPEISAVDALGNSADLPLSVTLTNLSDAASVVVPSADWTNVPSGAYKVTIAAESPELADTFSLPQVFVYRPTDKMPPAEMPLFVPVRSVRPGDSLLVGTSYSDSNILLTLWNGDRIFRQEWLTPSSQGNMLLSVNLPDSVSEATLTLATLRNYSTEEISVSVRRPDIRRSLNLKFESFRNKMVPGERERWSISVTDNLGSPAPAALMLDVYSKALDAIRPFGWNFNVYRMDGKVFSLNNTGRHDLYARSSKILPLKRGLIVPAPSFNLYNRSWPVEEVYSDVRLYSMNMKQAMFAAADAGDAEMRGVQTDLAFDKEEAVTGEASAYTAEESVAPTVNDYRMPDVASALWQPVLVTAPDGTLKVEFEAPNANTTWKLLCQAYDMQMLSGSYTAEIVASKPIMVSAQVPRFLRVGDRIQLRALLMNATDSLAAVSSFIEIFDPVTAEILQRSEFSDSIPAGRSATIALNIVAPERTMLGVRVKAQSGNFSDGEQSVIALLPAEVTARSTRPLFFPADSTDVSIDVERGGVLLLTTNAAWECVTALPGLLSCESKSAFSAVSALFSAAVGRGLVRTYPQIAAALTRWESEDSVLVSSLEKNEDLKIALLSSTPWVAAAQSDSERKARLLMLLDPRRSQSVISNAVDNLARLVRKGGLAWTPGSEEASQWVTEQVLLTLSRLKSLGYLPESRKLDRIISEAVTYLDNTVARDYAKYKGDYPDYAELRPSFASVSQSAPARRAQAATVQHLVSHWRDLGFTSKAQAALILNSNGYQTTAHRIIESLRQYEAWRQTGLNAVLLNAFAAVEPRSPEVDEIRQYFLERKQAMDWGDGLQTSALVASILSSGTDRLVPAANELSVCVDGNEISLAGVESVMGSFRLDLPEGGRVDVAKGRFPAWGGVFSCSVDSASAIQAAGSPDLTLTRRVEGDFSVGSRVKVSLEIEASRPLDYVVIKSPRCAGFSVIDQLPGYVRTSRSSVYREPCPTETNWFFNRLPEGKTLITEEFYVSAEGDFILAPAEAQSQYAPEFSARSSGELLRSF